MENKESLEQELALLEEKEQKNPASKRKSELKALNNKIFKSVEKQDAMRLLMLQYCSGLQNCFNSLEAQVQAGRNKSECLDGGHSEPSKASRSAAVGGFVRRASSSMKEKMSFIKKDFGRRGSKSGEDEQPSTSGGINNNGLNAIEEGEDVTVQESMEEIHIKRSRTPSDDHLEDLIDNSRIEVLKEVLAVVEVSVQTVEVPSPSSHPAIEIQVDEVDVHTGHDLDQNEPSTLTQDQSAIPRSNSDSSLEVNKMMNLRPEDILRYRGTSLPRLSAADETDSDSDYLVIDSSDEPPMTDSSDSDNNEDTVVFEDKKTRRKHEDSASARGQHRNTSQHLHTYQV